MQNDTSSGTAADQAAPARPAEERRPFLRVVRGNPTAEELAAVTVVLAARANAAAAAAGQARASTPARRSGWSARSRLLREAVSPGPGGWKRSALPR
ncbi:MAG: acyl-CoA carboxylase subunit epsilon [Streptosporangiaceae bacterium]